MASEGLGVVELQVVRLARAALGGSVAQAVSLARPVRAALEGQPAREARLARLVQAARAARAAQAAPLAQQRVLAVQVFFLARRAPRARC